MDYFIVFCIWWFAGLIVSSIVFGRNKGFIRVGDLTTIFLMSFGGLIWLVALLLDVLNDFLEKHRDSFLWKSRSKKTEEILFKGKDTPHGPFNDY